MTTNTHNFIEMQKYFEERMTKFEADLQRKVPTTQDNLAQEFAEFKTFIVKSLRTLSNQLDTISRDLDRMEMRSRRKMLLLHGIKEENDEDAAQVVSQVVKQRLGMDSFKAGDIKRCHRMGRQSSSQKPRPIVIKLHSIATRDQIWFAKTKLKNSGVTVSEFLTRTRHMTFMAARQKFGVTKCWTREGSVYVLGPDGNRHRISTLNDVDNIKGCESADKPAPKIPAAKGKRTAASSKR